MIERKRINIEFISKNDVVLTNLFSQKKFHLDNDITTIDAISMKKLSNVDFDDVLQNPPSSFFVTFFYDEVDDTYVGEVLARIEEYNLEAIGRTDYRDRNRNNKYFEVSVWIDD